MATREVSGQAEWSKSAQFGLGQRADTCLIPFICLIVTADATLLLSDETSEDGSAAPTALPSNLTALNLLYDLTPARYITAVASEVGLSGSESVAILLRDYKSILFGS